MHLGGLPHVAEQIDFKPLLFALLRTGGPIRVLVLTTVMPVISLRSKKKKKEKKKKKKACNILSYNTLYFSEQRMEEVKSVM